MHSNRVSRIVFASLAALCLTSVAVRGTTESAPPKPGDPIGRTGWFYMPIPDTWKRQPGGDLATPNGYAWYRCLVKVPADWKGKSIELNVEPVDDARQTFVNGRLVGTAGTFPPQYRSGLGQKSRYKVPAEALKFGEINAVAVRTYNEDPRSNFLVAPPILLADEELAIRTEGMWQYRPGDEKSWATTQLEGKISDDDPTLYTKVDEVDNLELYLRRRKGDRDPLTPAQAAESFEVAEDLDVEQVLAEPNVRQPLFMNFDERGRLWVLNYIQYPNPAGLKMVSRDKHLRTVYDKVPKAPPNHVRGKDKITIHEDTDGDGTFDEHKTFVDGLNMATSFERGRGGVWVLNPPYLLFYPDRDRDDVPDGDPVVHLEGFGLEDSHSLANSLRWGPDGWLYAAQGSTVTGHIKRPGLDKEPVHSMGQLIWRYHPDTRRYEIFAEGGGNTFGVEIDKKGRIFSGHNGGDTRGFHYVQGAYERKSFGKHGALSNPYAFGYFPSMKHHSVPRFTHNFVIYEATALPERYHGKLFGIEPLQGQIVQAKIWPNTSTFQTADVNRPVKTDDQWFRPVDIKAGPDGAIYFADFYEQRIDHSSHYAGRVDKDSGRIYRIQSKNPSHPEPFDYGELSSEELVKVLEHPNKWHRQTAIRLFADRKDKSVVPLLAKTIAENTGQLALEAFWALYVSGGLTDELASKYLDHEDPYVRLWTVRFLGDERKVSDEHAQELAELARREPYAEVRSQLASSARRLPAGQALPILRHLLGHSEDVDDLHIPLLLWWAIESKAGTDREAVVALFEDADFWKLPLVEKHILDRLIRRYALAGTRKDLLACAKLLDLAPEKKHQQILMKGFETAFKGRSLGILPDELLAAIKKAGGGSLPLRVRQKDPDAVAEALATIADESADTDQRALLITVFGEVVQPEAVPVLLDVAAKSKNNSLRSMALVALTAYDDEQIARKVIAIHDDLPEDVRAVAQSLLSSRRTWSIALLSAVDEKRLKKELISEEVLRKLLLHNDERIARLVEKHFGDVSGATTEQMQQRIDELYAMLSASPGSGNPYDGKPLFMKTCGKCHVLFKEGGDIGPDLTSYKRDDLRRMLVNVVNPSAEIREGFENYTVATLEGRIVTGFKVDEDNQVVVLRGTDGQNVVIRRDDVDEMMANPKSVMPEGQLKDLTNEQIKDLFAYLRSTQPLP